MSATSLRPQILALDERPAKAGNGHLAWHETTTWQAGQRPEKVESLVEELLAAVGEEPQREGLRQTPSRVARMYAELLAGYETDIESLVNGALFDVDYSDPVVVRDITFYSLCEHHLLPFYGKAHVAYLPGARVIGLSKIPRIVEMYARRLQVQERMTRQIADQLEETLRPQGVAVVVEGIHLCSAMRGVRQPEASMRTSVMRGLYQQDRELRAEFLSQLSGRSIT
jgi:GTP cyclohydrolase I